MENEYKEMKERVMRASREAIREIERKENEAKWEAWKTHIRTNGISIKLVETKEGKFEGKVYEGFSNVPNNKELNISDKDIFVDKVMGFKLQKAWASLVVKTE
jgi:hypothetical protein